MAAGMVHLHKRILFISPLILAMGVAAAAPRLHSVLLGPSRTVSVTLESGKAFPIKLRSLIVDSKFKEHTAGPTHDVNDRFFVIRKAVQLNDSLPDESGKPPRWIWRLEGWIGVDRQSGRVTQLNLPMFDHETSEVSWYRDLAAYCGISDDRSKAYLVVFQIGRRKPLLKKEFTGGPCSAPTWERQPTRVTFINGPAKSSFVVTSRGADPRNEPQETESKESDEDEPE
jgi:hypothetical protein